MSLKTALHSIECARQDVQALPADFAPPKAKYNGKPLETGTVVAVREKRRETYADLIAEEHMDALRVLAVAKGRVKVETLEGEYLGFMPRGHLSVVREEA
jgi:hypothetical protein